ncbi:MAG: hypothetical protein L0154_11570, partial [Chloroflexi bacterium]|nr:hypothetical protein [Chloroflexota bacterium]
GIYFRANDRTATQGDTTPTMPPTVTIPNAITCYVGDQIDVPVTYKGDFMDATISDSTVVDIRNIVDDGTGSGYLEIHCRAKGQATITVSVLPSEEGGIIPVTVLLPNEDYPLPQFITVPTDVTCAEGESVFIDITYEPAPEVGPPIGVTAILESQNIARIQRAYSNQANAGTVTIDCIAEGQSIITVYIFHIGDVTLDDFSKAASIDLTLTVEEGITPTPTVPTPVIVRPGSNPSPTNTPPRRPRTLPAPSATPTVSEYVKPSFLLFPLVSLDCVVGDIERIYFSFQAAPDFPGDIGVAADLSGNSVIIQQASSDAVNDGFVEINCVAVGTSTVTIQIFRVGDVTENDMSNANIAHTTVNVVEASPTPPGFEASLTPTPTGTASTPTPTPSAYVKPSYTSPPPSSVSCVVGEVKTITFSFQPAPDFGGPIGVTARSETSSAVQIQNTTSDEANSGSVTFQCVGAGTSTVTTFIFRIGDVSMEDFSKANAVTTTVSVTESPVSPP